MIRASTKTLWQYQEPWLLGSCAEILFGLMGVKEKQTASPLGPPGWYVKNGEIIWGPYTEREYSKVLLEQKTSPVSIGRHDSKRFWLYLDEFLVCDLEVEKEMIIGWKAQKTAKKKARLEQFRELGASVKRKMPSQEH